MAMPVPPVAETLGRVVTQIPIRVVKMTLAPVVTVFPVRLARGILIPVVRPRALLPAVEISVRVVTGIPVSVVKVTLAPVVTVISVPPVMVTRVSIVMVAPVPVVGVMAVLRVAAMRVSIVTAISEVATAARVPGRTTDAEAVTARVVVVAAGALAGAERRARSRRYLSRSASDAPSSRCGPATTTPNCRTTCKPKTSTRLRVTNSEPSRKTTPSGWRATW